MFTLCVDGAIKEDFLFGYAGCYCTDISCKTDEVTSRHKSFQVSFFLLESVVTNNLAIGEILLPVYWYFSCAR